MINPFFAENYPTSRNVTIPSQTILCCVTKFWANSSRRTAHNTLRETKPL